MARDVQKEIDDLVKSNHIVLFMKGSKAFPQCGFSATAVATLQVHDVDFEAVNVLADMEIREGVKQYSNWPTIPQCYVDGKFIGGSDVLREMEDTGELASVLRK